MKFCIQCCCYALLFGCGLFVQAKIVYLNGTEVIGGNLKTDNVTTAAEAPKWFSVFNPRNISNHSGTKTKIDKVTFNRKNDAEEEQTTTEEENDSFSNGTLATRDTTVLSSIRGIWSDLSPILTILSTILGIFLVFVLIESPLSPLPVPPLPYPPVGPYPPTNMYPFGVPPVRQHYAVQYSEPPSHGSYRIPRNMEMNKTETELFESVLEKIIESIGSSSHEDFTTPKKEDWTKKLMNNISSFFTSLSSIVKEKSAEFLEELKTQ